MTEWPPGIQIIDDVTAQEGIDTLEGKIGPLLLGEGCQCHFIELPAGGFCKEHPHATESLIFTVRGQWVLASSGKRFHMKAGSLFWFGPHVATGYEVPFGENAFILIFKGQRSDTCNGAMVQYLKGLRNRLVEQNRAGTPFTFAELPDDHPAREFASSLAGTG